MVESNNVGVVNFCTDFFVISFSSSLTGVGGASVSSRKGTKEVNGSVCFDIAAEYVNLVIAFQRI